MIVFRQKEGYKKEEGWPKMKCCFDKIHNNFPKFSLSAFLKSVIINSKLFLKDSLACFL